MIDSLVNGIYPVQYFSLPGVDTIKYPDSFWWSSKERYAAVDTDGVTYKPFVDGGSLTSEILEIDLGRIREINYINFDVLRAPISIKIEYDILSTPDRESVWLPVTPIEGQDFDQDVQFDPNNRTSWLNGEYNFTDSKGNMVHTRYIRITFSRRDVSWPTQNNAAFPWPVFVKQLRIGRNTASLIDTVGPLLTQDTPLGLDEVDLLSVDGIISREARQQFVVSPAQERNGISPNMLGFGVLIQSAAPTTPFDQSEIPGEVSIGWSVWDVTNSSAPVFIINGVENMALTTGLSWLDWYLDQATQIPIDFDKIYELRVYSKDVSAADIVFTHTPNVLSNTPIPGTLSFTHGSSAVSTSVDTRPTVKIGQLVTRSDIPDQVFLVNNVTNTTITLNVAYTGADASGVTGAIVYPFSTYDEDANNYVGDGSRNLVCRVWADIGDEGRDVLGNSYRYVNRQQSAENALATSDMAGWMSDPSPSPDAVEALYFDVRGVDSDTGDPIPQVIEAITIAPRTPGVRMNVYWTMQGLNGSAPVQTTDWDYLLWTPVQQTYTLRRDETIQLPQAFRAAFVKLEFSALNPIPYKLSTYPPPPPKVFRRFPTWVEDQFNNSQLRNLVASWFLSNATPVQTNVLKSLSDPVLEFQYEQQQFLAALALGTITDSQVVNSGLVDIADKALIDPTTASKVYVSFDNQYQNTLLLSVDQSSVLGQMVAARFDPSTITDPNEATATSVVSGQIPFVSTTNNRLQESYSNLAQTPMWFNKTARHVYTEDQAEFNKKAYFVGIEKVRFLRNDYTVERDDPVILDNLFDDFLLTENTFGAEEGTSIPDGAVLYVSYSINPVITDEQVTLVGFGPVELSQVGGPAYEVLVFDKPGQQGNQYFQDLDYELSYGFDSDGRLVNSIQRTSFGNRLTVPLQPIVYVDAGTVIGHAVIPSPPTDDSAVVIGVAVVSAEFEGPPVPTYGTGHYGTGTYADLFGPLPLVDSSKITGHAAVSGSDAANFSDVATIIGVTILGDPLIGETGTVIGHSVITSTDTVIYVDNQTAVAVAVPSAVTIGASVDAGTAVAVAVPSAADIATYVDAQPVFGVAAISATGEFIDPATSTDVFQP